MIRLIRLPVWICPATAALLLIILGGFSAVRAGRPAVGPVPQVPEGGSAPGAFPNAQVTGVNVTVLGGSVFDGNAEVPALAGQGPIPWSLNRYNRGDFSLRLAPSNSAAALANTLDQGFIEFSTPNDASRPENQAWRPSAVFGVAIPTARQNGPIDWNDGEGPLFPTVAISPSSSGFGYSMTDGSFGSGNLDINTGRAGTHGSSPEANFSFSVAWFPYDAGWLAGNFGNPDPTTGVATWEGPGQHSVGLSAALMSWAVPPSPPGDGASFGGLGQLRLPGVDATTDGMLFTTSSQGNSDVNIVGVAPVTEAATGASSWHISVREDAATTALEHAVGQSQFSFVYVPYNSPGLVGGHINGRTGAKLQAAGTFSVTRTAVGVYEVSIPGKTGTSGTLLLQAAELEADTEVPMATRCFLSYEFSSTTGTFVVHSRKTTSESTADLSDSDFYLAWIDFAAPLTAPAGPRLRSQDAVVVAAGTGGEGEISPKEAGIATNSKVPEILVTLIDENNSVGYTDPLTGNPASHVVLGYFFDPVSLSVRRGPFPIMGSSAGVLNRMDVAYNPVSDQYIVVANARAYSPVPSDLVMIARVNSGSVAGDADPASVVSIYDGVENGLSYDDVTVAVSSRNGNFVVVAERKVQDEGEGAFGALFASDGTPLTPSPSRLDLVQSAGDEDDPDVVYLPSRDVFLYLSNTDGGPFTNHIVGSVIQTVPAAGALQVSGPEQSLSTGTGVQGHPAAIENALNGEIITAYDFGNTVAQGNLSFSTLGAAPTYSLSEARPEVPYLDGPSGNPFNHRHPQLAMDPASGVIVVGHNATGSTVGHPDGYVFSLFDTTGAPLPTQLGAPYFLSNTAAGPIDSDPAYHNVIYDALSGSFFVVFTAGPSPTRVTSLASLTVTSTHLPAPASLPALSIEPVTAGVRLRWPNSPAGFVLTSTSDLATPWLPVTATPILQGSFYELIVSPLESRRYFRLEN